MKLDINEDYEKEANDLINKLKLIGYNLIDECIVEKRITLTSTERINIYYAIYPELLFYDDKIVPWLCIETELEGLSDDVLRKTCRFIINDLDSCGVKLFMDEDAYMQHFKKIDNKGWVSLKCYTNPDYLDAYWENHVL